MQYLVGMRMLTILLGCLVISFSALAQTFQGKVVSIKDGDTIEMLVKGKKVRIRLFGIDAPERGQPHANKAKEYVSDLCFGKTVKALQKNKDQYGRVVAEIYLSNGSSLNHQIVAAGYAWQYKQFNKSAELAAAEQNARVKKLGLWQDARPVAPWDWRKQKRKAPKKAA